MSVTIREATMNDAAELRRYAIALFGEKLPGIFRRDDLTMEHEIEFLAPHVERDNAVMLVAEDDGQIVGNIGFSGGKLAELAHAGEFGISLARGYRGRGIGTRLIRALEGWAPGHGITSIEVHAFSTNPGGLRLYERLGYEHEGLLRRAAMVDGEPVDIFVLSKLLG